LSKYIPDALLRSFLLKNLERNSNNEFQWRINIPVLIDALDHIIGGVDYSFFEDRLPIFSYPVLFIRGDESGYIIEDDFVKVKRIWPEAHIETIANAGHWLHFEKQNEFLEVLTRFLK
jgi:pimeloyl-ACP methyl ester carboxylesterase